MKDINEEVMALKSEIERIDRLVKTSIESEIKKSCKELMGQYFTPGNVIDMMIEILNPLPSEIIVEPSSGCGNILIHLHSYFYRRYKEYNGNINGIEIDKRLIEVSNLIHERLNFSSKVECGDALQVKELNDSVDVIIGNPPFGKHVSLNYNDFLTDSRTVKTLDKQINNNERIEVLFLKKCVNMLKEGGRMGLVLPDGILGNDGNTNMRKWLLQQGQIIAIVSLPIETFMPFTSVKTSALFFKKTKQNNQCYRIFMAIAETCGHDRRGNKTSDDDVMQIAEEYRKWNLGNQCSQEL